MYAIRRGPQALLIDFGTGQVLEHLVEIAVVEAAPYGAAGAPATGA